MRKNLIANILLIAITAIIVFAIFKPVILHPNNYLFSHGGDAVKSYFNFSYYLKYDSGLKFDGINYPYGEHLQYDNSHPFHSLVSKLINRVVNIQQYGVSIINLLMITALLLAVPFLFLILRYYKLPVWYSFIISLIILFLSPQLDRINGHFEMVYLYFIPMFWYFLLKFREPKKKWLWASLLLLSGIIGGFTSAYFVAFYAIFLLSVLFADLWFNRKNLKAYAKDGLILLGMAIFPLLVVRGVVSITDWVSDRPNNPWGFYVFHANPFSIFLPPNTLLREILGKWININYQWEGRSYVGFPATILATTIVIDTIRRVVFRKSKSAFFQNDNLNTYLLGALLILLFSMCIPFKLGFGFLLEILTPVKQFRALGRFAWIFYYVFSVYTAYYIYHLFLRLKEKQKLAVPVLLMSLTLGLWSADAVINAKKRFQGIFLENNLLEANDSEYEQLLKSANIDVSDYQAIFFLPFANTSGDKLFFENGLGKAFGEAMRCSYHTGLPLIQSFSPRLSFSNALSTIQLLSDSTIRKTRLDDMTEKPILLVSTPEKLTSSEQRLKDKSQLLYSDERISLSKVELSTFHNSYNNWLNYADSTKNNLTGNNHVKADVELSKIYILDFDELKSEHQFSGNGALFQRRNNVQVFSENFGSKGLAGNYRLSFWMFFDTRMYDMPSPKINTLLPNGKIEATKTLNSRAIHNAYNQWVLVEENLNIEQNKTYQMEISGKYITIDNLLLQPIGSKVLTLSSEGKEFLNNFPLN